MKIRTLLCLLALAEPEALSVKGLVHPGPAGGHTVQVTARDHDYEGVPLQALLGQAGGISGHDLRGTPPAGLPGGAGPGRRCGRVLQVLVVFKQDGQPLPGGWGLIVPGDKRPGCWVRMLKSTPPKT